jgi:hypothetical protein
MKEELENMWKEAGVCAEELKNVTKYQDSRCPGRDWNRTTPEYESGALPLLWPVRCGVAARLW